jgi:hypothetical protein
MKKDGFIVLVKNKLIEKFPAQHAAAADLAKAQREYTELSF